MLHAALNRLGPISPCREDAVRATGEILFTIGLRLTERGQFAPPP
jgi:hypothetical protein